MIGVFDFLNPKHEGMDPAQARLLRGVSDEMMTFIAKKDIGEAVFNKVTGDDSKELDHEAKKLDILLKKRQLGMDYDDDDYEGLVNHNSSNPLTIAAASMTMRKTRPSVMALEEYLPEAIPYIMKMETPPGPGGDLLKLPMKTGGVLNDSINVIQGRINNGKRVGKLGGLLKYFK